MTETVQQPVAASGGKTADRPVTRPGLWLISAATALVLLLWCFPSVWYTRADSTAGYAWLVPARKLTGWEFKETPVGKSAERQLVADELINGTLSPSGGGSPVQVFLANRYSEKPNDVGLFVHTPDRCWTEAGWRIEPIVPDHLELKVQGISMVFERRLFSISGHKELLYFGGLVGGQPVPYRLDYNLSVGARVALEKLGRSGGSQYRVVNGQFWRRIWDSFASRTQLFGPKQFVRISTELEAGGTGAADQRLQTALDQWLQSASYQDELRRWRSQPAKPAG